MSKTNQITSIGVKYWSLFIKSRLTDPLDTFPIQWIVWFFFFWEFETRAKREQ